MLYIAIAMILVGVLCFVYVSLAPQDKKSELANKKDSTINSPTPLQRNPSEPGKRRHNLSEEEYQESLYYTKNHEPMIREEEERILREREFSFRPPSREPNPGNYPTNEPESTVYTQVKPIEDKPAILESVKILDRDGESVEPAPEEKLIVDGLVYLDHQNKLSWEKRDFTQRELQPEAFQEIRRIGEGAVFEESGKLIFRVKNLSYTFEPRDIKQVVFYDEAVVFVPNRSDYSTVLFFTQQTDALRAFFAQAEAQLTH